MSEVSRANICSDVKLRKFAGFKALVCEVVIATMSCVGNAPRARELRATTCEVDK